MMNTKIFLVLGLIYAGAAAGEPNGTSKRSDDGDRLTLVSGYNTYPQCNYCVTNVATLLIRAEEVKEEEGRNYFDTPYACMNTPNVDESICHATAPYLRKLKNYNQKQSKYVCGLAGYCPKNPPTSQPSRPNSYSDHNVNKYYESKTTKPKVSPHAPHTHDGHHIPPHNHTGGDAKKQLDYSCKVCQNIVSKAKQVTNMKKELLPSYLPFLCTELDGKESDYCFNYVNQKGYEIISLLVEGMSPAYICRVIKQCYEPQPLCRACSNYVGQIYTMYYSSEIEACSYLPTEMSKQCVTKLKQHKKQIYHYADNNIPGSQICRTLQYCDEAVNPPTKNIINFNTVSESSYDSYDEAWAGLQNEFN